MWGHYTALAYFSKTKVSFLLSLCPKLYNSFPTVMKWLPGHHHTLFKNWEKLKCFVREEIAKHREDWNPADTRDFIDCYLKEIAKVIEFHEQLTLSELTLRT